LNDAKPTARREKHAQNKPMIGSIMGIDRRRRQGLLENRVQVAVDET
jgi:hypothetical protein